MIRVSVLAVFFFFFNINLFNLMEVIWLCSKDFKRQYIYFVF